MLNQEIYKKTYGINCRYIMDGLPPLFIFKPLFGNVIVTTSPYLTNTHFGNVDATCLTYMLTASTANPKTLHTQRSTVKDLPSKIFHTSRDSSSVLHTSVIVLMFIVEAQCLLRIYLPSPYGHMSISVRSHVNLGGFCSCGWGGRGHDFKQLNGEFMFQHFGGLRGQLLGLSLSYSCPQNACACAMQGGCAKRRLFLCL